MHKNGTALIISVGLSLGAPAAAATMLSATGAVVNAGGTALGSIMSTINQSGLSSNYISGITDFDAYFAGAPTHNNDPASEWRSDLGEFQATVTFDLGTVRTIDRFALWNEPSGGLSGFNLLGSLDGTGFTEFFPRGFPTDNVPFVSYPAEVFNFAAV